jgi:hypothetical protein
LFLIFPQRHANNENPQPEVFIKLLKYIKQQNPAFYINTGCSGACPYAPEDEGGFNHFLIMQIKA